MRLLLSLLLLLSIIAGGGWWGWLHLHAAPETKVLADGSRLTWEPCWFDVAFPRVAHCGRLHVAGASSFRLPVVYLPALAWERRAPPVLYVAGGPGGATGLTREEMPGWLAWLEHVDWGSDVILYDQRGVGLSDPAVACPESAASRRALLDSGLPAEKEYALMREALLACRDRLQGEGWDFGVFSTPRNAGDALKLVEALGLRQWRMYAVSYGTRIALDIQRKQPPGLQAVVLDSVYPPQVAGEGSDSWLLNRSLQLFMRSCELLSDCDLHPERLYADLENAFGRLSRRPLSLDLRDPDNGDTLPVVLDADDLAWLIFESQYVWNNLHLLPGAISSLANGNVSVELRKMLQMSVDLMLDDSLSEAVANSVDCADNPPFTRELFEQQLQQFPLVAHIRRLDWDFSPCRDWPSGDSGSGFRQPVASAIPTLLLAGEFDPVTPPQWASMAARGLSSSYVFTFPGIGHGVLDSDQCGAEVVRAFLRAPESPATPDCLAHF